MLDSPVKKSGFIVLSIGIILIFIVGIGKISKVLKKNDENQIAPTPAYYKVLDTYMNGLIKKDVSVLKKTLPSFSISTEDELNTQISQFYGQYESVCGDDIKINYSFVESEKKADAEVEEYNQALLKQFPNASKVKEVYMVKTRIIVTGSKSSNSYIIAMYVCLIDNDWKILI